MITQQTSEKLLKLKLSAFVEVCDDMANNNSYTLSLEEALALMVDRELLQRQQRKQARLLKMAKLHFPQATLEDIDYRLPRQFNQQQFRSLASMDWLQKGRNIIFTGPTGVGKSHLACALGHLACRELFHTEYYRVPRLIEQLRLSHADGTYTRCLDAIAKKQLLILDDWGIDQLDRQARRDLLEVLEDRCGKASTIITTQLPIEHWHDYIGDGTIADAICDRVINQAYRFNMTGESVRKEKNRLTNVDHSV